ncbi:MAG: Hsp70 family protein [Anaerolineales bacterium]|jgi:predicted nucleic acid-binding Zn ribbon protein
MSQQDLHTLFALDCGATNWRLARIVYKSESSGYRAIGEPQPAPLSSFIDRRLPAIIQLNKQGDAIESIGEIAQQALEVEEHRERVRDHFKPCIGAHLATDPLPHQKRFTHVEAIQYTRMLFNRVAKQLRDEKWHGMPFDSRVSLTLAYPVHWGHDHNGVILEEFRQCVLSCLDETFHGQVRFVAEPEGAMLSLSKSQVLAASEKQGVTLIADIGGSTTDIIAGRWDADAARFDLLGRYGEPHGGGLYDAELAKHLADEIGIPASSLADDPSLMLSIRESARRIKESLSRRLLDPGTTLDEVQRTITLISQGGDVFRRTVRINEDVFILVTRELNEAFKTLVENCLTSIKLMEEDISQVVLVGGGSLLFSIIRHMRDRFGSASVVLADNPEEIIVKGVALELGESLKPRLQIAPSVPDSVEVLETEDSGTEIVSSEMEDGIPVDADELKLCPACGASVRQGIRYCEECGTDLQEEELRFQETAAADPAPQSTCPLCGEAVREGTKFCEACGEKLNQ